MSEVIDDLVEQVRHRIRLGNPNVSIKEIELKHTLEDVIAEFQPNSQGSDLTSPAFGTKEDAIRELSGMGKLQPLLDDSTVEEIWINEPGRVFVARNGKSELTNLILTEQQVRTLVERMLASTGRRIDLANPFVDATLPDGSRLHVVIPDITKNHWSVNIRKFVMGSSQLIPWLMLVH